MPRPASFHLLCVHHVCVCVAYCVCMLNSCNELFLSTEKQRHVKASNRLLPPASAPAQVTRQAAAVMPAPARATTHQLRRWPKMGDTPRALAISRVAKNERTERTRVISSTGMRWPRNCVCCVLCACVCAPLPVCVLRLWFLACETGVLRLWYLHVSNLLHASQNLCVRTLTASTLTEKSAAATATHGPPRSQSALRVLGCIRIIEQRGSEVGAVLRWAQGSSPGLAGTQRTAARCFRNRAVGPQNEHARTARSDPHLTRPFDACWGGRLQPSAA